ncbi:hypothetical protein DL93DRAFT_2088781 [Clavulina sp. PMI_390]|nr:hypothetical protein DL93DRAFT_2088781 [Clavulina sp. PMI_390]
MEDGNLSVIPTSSAARLEALLAHKFAWETFTPRYHLTLEDYDERRPGWPLDLTANILTIATYESTDDGHNVMRLESHELPNIDGLHLLAKPKRTPWIFIYNEPSSHVSLFDIKNELAIITSE